MKKTIKILLLLSFTTVAFAQVEIRPLGDNPSLYNVEIPKKRANTILTLPFIEDFSNYREMLPDAQRWQDFQVYLNNDLALFPPSIGVATLDGLDATGKLYGEMSTYPSSGDTLTSHVIRLDSVFFPFFRPLSLADSLYFSFFYQPGGGYGEIWEPYRKGTAPTNKDELILEFFDAADSTWNKVWSTKGQTLDAFCPLCRSDTAIQYKEYFKLVMLPITDTKYLSKGFQFRFRNMASLVEPTFKHATGQWHIDYIKLDIDRSCEDKYSSDLTFIAPPQKMLKRYYAMPARQYNVSEMADNFSINFSNLNGSGGFVGEYFYEIFDKNDAPLFTSTPTNVNIYSFYEAGYNSEPNIFTQQVQYVFPQNNDYQKFTMLHYLNAQALMDVILENNTVENTLELSNYFAYDDGVADAGFGLISQSGNAKFAQRFKLNVSDTLVAVQTYFNASLENPNDMRYKIVVWNATNDSTPSEQPLFESDWLLPENDVAGYKTFVFDNPIVLNTGNFFIGFVQESNVFMNIGFDQNYNAEGAMFYYDQNYQKWFNIFHYGSVMMRPIFGSNALVGTKPIVESLNFVIYPNPCSDYFVINCNKSNMSDKFLVQIYDVGGKLHISQLLHISQKVNVVDLPSGTYFLKIGDSVQKFVKK